MFIYSAIAGLYSKNRQANKKTEGFTPSTLITEISVDSMFMYSAIAGFYSKNRQANKKNVTASLLVHSSLRYLLIPCSCIVRSLVFIQRIDRQINQMIRIAKNNYIIAI